MKSINAKSILIPALSLFLICLIVTTLLTLTNKITNPIIDNAENEKSQQTRKVVLPKASSFEEVNGEEDTFEGIDDTGKTVGYVFTTKAKGYGGEMSVMTGISNNGKVEGVFILSQNETPGLGANATREDFRNQFKGDVPQNGFEVVKGEADENKIEAMTGATISSKAVTDAVNIAVDKFKTIKGIGGD